MDVRPTVDIYASKGDHFQHKGNHFNKFCLFGQNDVLTRGGVIGEVLKVTASDTKKRDFSGALKT